MKLVQKAVGFDGNNDDNHLSQSAKIRKEVHDAIPAKHELFEKESGELGDLIDETEDLSELEIGEINKLVCGVETEECDESCGGALCKTPDGKAHCGNPNYNLIGSSDGEGLCESSAYKMAQRALNHADTAEQTLNRVRNEVDDALDETAPIRALAEDAFHKADHTHTEVGLTKTTAISAKIKYISSFV